MAENIYVADPSGSIQSPYGPLALKQPNAREPGKVYRQWGNEADGATAKFYEMTAPEQAAWEAESEAARLDNTRARLRADFIAEGVIRIVAQVPEWDTLEEIKRVAVIWTRLGPAPPAQALARDIYLYVRDTALPKLAALASQAELDAIDPTAADPFGDGSFWPT